MLELVPRQAKGVQFFMLPFMMGSYTCRLVLVDPKVSEWVIVWMHRLVIE